jgi:hypothetical protein
VQRSESDERTKQPGSKIRHIYDQPRPGDRAWRRMRRPYGDHPADKAKSALCGAPLASRAWDVWLVACPDFSHCRLALPIARAEPGRSSSLSRRDDGNSLHYALASRGRGALRRDCACPRVNGTYLLMAGLLALRACMKYRAFAGISSNSVPGFSLALQNKRHHEGGRGKRQHIDFRRRIAVDCDPIKIRRAAASVFILPRLFAPALKVLAVE